MTFIIVAGKERIIHDRGKIFIVFSENLLYTEKRISFAG